MTASAWLGGQLARNIVETSTDLSVLQHGGWWAVVLTFEGEVRLWRFADVRRAPLPPVAARWIGPAPDSWRSSLSRETYLAGVHHIRQRIRDGDVYQVNLCRVLSAPIGRQADPWALAAELRFGNPAPFAGVIDVPARDGVPRTTVVSASPELFLRRSGQVVTTSPIKGT